MSSPLEFRRLVAGLDTVQVAYYLKRTVGAEFDFGALMLVKERLRSNKIRDGEIVALGDWSFVVQAYGSGSGYPLVLEHRDFTIECGEHNTPGFYVTFRSHALWQRGALVLHEEFIEWANSVGLITVGFESLSRVDFTFDYLFPGADLAPDRVVSLSAKDSQYREDGRVQTISFGKGDVVLRIYDKTVEIAQQSEKVWFFDLWGVKENVWRIEWQVRKDVLKRFGIRTFEDLFGGQGDVLRYLASEHDSLRVPTDDSNRSRWPVHPLWEDLIAQIEDFDCEGVYREVDPEATLREREMRIAISVYGYLKRVGAIRAHRLGQVDCSYGEAHTRLRELMDRVHSPVSWRLDVDSRLQKLRIGVE